MINITSNRSETGLLGSTKLLKMKRGYMMNFASELYVVLSRGKEKKAIKDSPLSVERDNWLAIYEDIEKIVNGKPSSNMDLDIHLMLHKLV